MGFPKPERATAPVKLGNFAPLLAPLVRQRFIAWWIAGIALVHLALAQTGWGGLGCPIREFTGVPCPGCGLTTACLHFFHGEWRSGFASHAFAPVFLLGLLAILLGAILPTASRLSFAAMIARYEERTDAAFWLALALVTYWIMRSL